MPSPLGAIVFDLDGTLVDSNPLQVQAWMASINEHGYKVGRDRIEREIGKGGDQLVEPLLGQDVEKEEGESLREGQSRHAGHLIRRQGVSAFKDSIGLLEACRTKSLKVALATSSSGSICDALLKSGGIDRGLFDLIVTGDEVKSTKPEADIYELTIQRLNLSPAECVNVGDTPYDCIGARKAGLVTIGLHDGLNDSDALRQSGARTTVADPSELLAKLDELLWSAAPRSVRLTNERAEQLMEQALAQAVIAIERGEAPIGCVVADGEGNIIGRGFNRLNSTGDRINHAEIIALHEAAAVRKNGSSGWIVVSTLEPCVMCFGASLEAGIDTVLYALPAPADGGAERVTPPTSPECRMPRIVGRIMADRSRELFEKWMAMHPPKEQAAFGKQLLERV